MRAMVSNITRVELDQATMMVVKSQRRQKTGETSDGLWEAKSRETSFLTPGQLQSQGTICGSVPGHKDKSLDRRRGLSTDYLAVVLWLDVMVVVDETGFPLSWPGVPTLQPWRTKTAVEWQRPTFQAAHTWSGETRAFAYPIQSTWALFTYDLKLEWSVFS